MNLQPLRRFAVQVLVVVVALAAVLTSGAPAQSLGDVAKQEQARRKDGAGKTYTNNDLRPAPAPAATSPAPPAATAPADDSKAAGKPDGKAADGDAKADPKAPAKPDAKTDAKSDAKAADGKTDEKADARPTDPKGDAASWRKRQKDLQDALDRSKLFADSLQSRINGLSADFSARDDPAQRSVVAADRQRALTELDRVKKEIQKQTKDLSDLQEEARKSGVPPGWLR
ncbi:MAG TPA: hypothetical protein VGQ37_04290 [Vicinamibacterales bacterium]|nr:hypothetical protein [Vicinamibacterales bacterium]